MLSVQNAIGSNGVKATEFSSTKNVKALVFEFDHPGEPQLKVITDTNTYYLSATVRKIPDVSRVQQSALDDGVSSVSSFKDRCMFVREPSEADTTNAPSMEDISDVTLLDEPATLYRAPPQEDLFTPHVPKPVTQIKRKSGPPFAELPITEDRRIRNRHYSFISVKVRKNKRVGIALLRSFRITREHLVSQIPCTICDKNYKLGDAVVVLPCSHIFHKSCILWYLNKMPALCPVCGFDVTEPNHPVFSDLSVTTGDETSDTLSEDNVAFRSI